MTRSPTPTPAMRALLAKADPREPENASEYLHWHCDECVQESFANYHALRFHQQRCYGPEAAERASLDVLT